MVSEILPISKQTTLKYPRSIAFIVSNEFCERFNFYGMRTILVLYLRMKLNYDEDESTVLFHIFTSLVYLSPLLGAILADSWLDKFKTIFILSIVYAIGSVIVSMGAVPPLNLPVSETTILGLALIAFGTGGIKPCVSAFGGDQFKIPEQTKQLATFFSLFYFVINAGSLISTWITPILRQDVHCFGDLDCFSLAFGVPGVLMVLSIIIFVAGKSLYTVKKPTGNMIVLVSKCITHAVSQRSKDEQKRVHWLDHAEPKYGKQLVDDIKKLGNILILFLPLPIFWALFDQQGSRWTFQATLMDGNVGLFTIKPDQMQVINPFLCLFFIPFFEYAGYPILAKVGITKPLQKLTLGGFLAGISFLLSGLLELQLQKSYAIVPKAHEGQIRIFNGMPCTFDVETEIPNHENFILKSLQIFNENYVHEISESEYSFKLEATSGNCTNFNGTVKVRAGKSLSYFVTRDSLNQTIMLMYEDATGKSKSGHPLVRVLSNTFNRSVILQSADEDLHKFKFQPDSTELRELLTNRYLIYIENVPHYEVDLQMGAVVTVQITETDDNEFSSELHVITPHNSINMLWLIPQYVVITAGEVMFAVTGLEFSFTQAPLSMKSVLQACWLLTVALGNVFVVIIAQIKIFDTQSSEFFLFAVLMFIDMGIFAILALKYRYANGEYEDSESVSLKLDKHVQHGGELHRDHVVEGITNKAFTSDLI